MRYFEQFKEAIVDKASYFNSEQNIRDDMGTTYLLDKKGFKATAAAVNIYDDLWAYGCALKEPSQNEAIKKALAECEINRKKYKVKDKCKLHMIGNIYIYEKTQNEIQKILKLMETKDGPISLYRLFKPMSLPDEGIVYHSQLPIVTPAMIYADLLGYDDARCRETAKLIRKRYLGWTL